MISEYWWKLKKAYASGYGIKARHKNEILWINRSILVDQNSCFIKVGLMPELLK